jgi:hypothetical protein
MRKNGSTIDIMDHHYQHHPLAFGLFRISMPISFLDVPHLFRLWDYIEGDFRNS